MKESKLGGKKHGMVLIISVGKKGDKDPVHAADPDTKKKASIEDLQQESATMRAAGDKLNARRFADVADAMGRGPSHRQSLIDRFGTQASNAITNEFPEMADDEGYGEMMYEEGRDNPDYQEARSDKGYLGESRKPFMQAISSLARGKKKVTDYDENAQQQLQQLIADDPTKYFADKRMMDLQKGFPIPPEVLGGGALVGLGGAALTHFMAWLTERLDQPKGYERDEQGNWVKINE